MNRHTGSSSDQNSRAQTAQPPRNPTPGAKNQRSQHTSAEAGETDVGVDVEKPDAQGVEGEGSYTATHRYNEGVREHIQKHDIEREAEAAREALEGDERQELEEAEQRGKLGATQSAQGQKQASTAGQSGARSPQPTPQKR
jgi:hypothetical protein